MVFVARGGGRDFTSAGRAKKYFAWNHHLSLKILDQIVPEYFPKMAHSVSIAYTGFPAGLILNRSELIVVRRSNRPIMFLKNGPLYFHPTHGFSAGLILNRSKLIIRKNPVMHRARRINIFSVFKLQLCDNMFLCWFHKKWKT